MNDPIAELLEACRDLDGSLVEGKVRAALAQAYRQGFAEMRSRLPADPQCSVPFPAYVKGPLEAEADDRNLESRAAELKRRLGL
ncbi:MAG: hypothetical protein O9327_02390 [Polaromonas sp.]|nr:hypothetical protein [Polaromonas sp.]